MVGSRLAAHIESSAPEYLEGLFALLRQPSISTEGVGLPEAAELVRQVLQDAGADARILPTRGHPAVLGEIPSTASLTVLIYGHYDVQPTGDLKEWDTPPFEPVIRQGRVFARGSADNKGQFLAQIFAIKTLREVLGELPVRVRFLIEGEEEIGSPNLAAILAENLDDLRANVFLRADGAIHYSGRPQIVLGQKGMLYVELSASNGNHEIHSMEAPVVPNPAWELVQALGALVTGRKVQIPGFYDDVKPVTPREREVLELIPLDRDEFRLGIGAERLVPDLDGSEFWAQLHLAPTCNIAGLNSGYTGPGTKTIIPPVATAKLDLRLVPDQDPDQIFRGLQRFLEEIGARAVMAKKLKAIRPARTSLDHPIVDILKSALQVAYGMDPVVLPSSKGTGPAFLFTDLLKVPYVLVPCAQIDSNMHAPNENLEVGAFLRGIRATSEIVLKLAENEERILEGSKGHRETVI